MTLSANRHNVLLTSACTFIFLQVLLVDVAADSPAPAPVATATAPSPEATRQKIKDSLAALGVPTSELAYRLPAGVNPAQVNYVLNAIIASRLAEAFQKNALTAQQVYQQVIAALANPSAADALSPAAKTQYEAVVELAKDPTFANPPVAQGVTGRKLLMKA